MPHGHPPFRAQPIPGPLHNASQHLSLSLQGKIPMKEKFQLTDANDHGPLLLGLQVGGDLLHHVRLDDIVHLEFLKFLIGNRSHYQIQVHKSLFVHASQLDSCST
jgi:hypothetical protein